MDDSEADFDEICKDMKKKLLLEKIEENTHKDLFSKTEVSVSKINDLLMNASNNNIAELNKTQNKCGGVSMLNSIINMTESAAFDFDSM